jgi:hypothetical protein
MTLACTESSRKESQAIERAKTLWLQSLKTEAAETISGKTSFRSSYADIMFEKSEFTVEPADPKQDANTVTVKVKSVPQPVRKVLMEIIAKMDANKESRFNIPDATALIYKQLGLSETLVSAETYKIDLSK